MRLQGTTQRPTSLETHEQRASREPARLRPGREGHCAAIEGQQAIAATVAILRGACRPSAIAWRVGAVVVDPVKARSWRTSAHIAQERGEVAAPLFTHRDPPSAVLGIGGVPLVEATALRADPGVILRGLWPRVPVSSVPLSGALSVEAPATLDPAALQVAARHRRATPAVAATEPVDVAGGCPIAPQDEEPSESASDQIDEGRHERTIAHHGATGGTA